MSASGDGGKHVRLAQWLRGDGIEIGALHNPIPVPAGARVRYVDRLTNVELCKQYPDLSEADLAPVSIIGDAEDLRTLPDGSVDFVIASHLVEHLQNPIRGLLEMHRVLRPGGILYIALPEPRVTFDRRRKLTSSRHLIEEFRTGTAATARAHFEDWVDNVEMFEPWWQIEKPEREARIDRLIDMGYAIHFHVWRPDTFLAFLLEAQREAGFAFELVEFAACRRGVDDEFIMVLAKGIQALPLALPETDTSAAAPARGGASPSGFRVRLSRGPVGPILRPLYRAVRRLLRRG